MTKIPLTYENVIATKIARDISRKISQYLDCNLKG